MGQGERTISRICEQPNIFHSILIFVPNIWGGRGIQNTEIKKYSCCLSALRPRFKSEGGETNFWDVCTTQHFSFDPDIRAHPFGGGFKIQKYINTAVVSGMCINPNISIFNKSSLIFVPNIWGAGNIFLGAVLEWMGEAEKSIMECVKTFFNLSWYSGKTFLCVLGKLGPG